MPRLLPTMKIRKIWTHEKNCYNTVNFLNIRTHKIFAVIILKVEQWRVLRIMHPKDTEGMANSVDPDQTAPLMWVRTVCPDLSVLGAV